ncbi:MAG: TonB family protein [Chryseolinea sp.]
MKQNTDVSDEEIRSYMNFDSLLANSIKMRDVRLKRTAGLVFALIIFSCLSTWLVIHSQQESERKVDVPLKPDVSDPRKENLIPPAAAPEKETNSSNARASDHAASNKTPGGRKDNVKETGEKAIITADVYIQAEPLEGYAALYAYFNENLKYPMAAVQDSIQGVETVAFTINTVGKPENISIRQSLGKLFDVEAIRVISTMPLWKPASLNGVRVSSQMSIPLTFQLARIKPGKP